MAFLFLAILTGSAAAEIRFKHHYIDRTGPEGQIFSNTILGDLDKDGRIDVIVGRSRYGSGPQRLYWYRNLGRIDRWSEPIVLSNQAACGCGGVVLDVDRDGWPDIVADGWYRNPTPPVRGAEFRKNDGFLSHLNAEVHDTVSADLDGDGRDEVIVYMQYTEPGVYVFKAGKTPGDPWQKTPALALTANGKAGARQQSDVHAAISPRGFGDIDSDGDADIVFCGSWIENADGKGTQWKEHRNIDFTRRGGWGKAVHCWVVDMDKDGRMDFVQSECDMPKARVAWFRNVRGDGSQWEMHLLPEDGAPGDFHSLAVADFDFDGDWDVYVDEMEHLNVPKGREGKIGMIVWENLDGKGARWKKHVVVEGLGGHQAQIADLDGDGDIDIVTRPYKPHQNVNGGRMHVSVLENLVRNPDAAAGGRGKGRGAIQERLTQMLEQTTGSTATDPVTAVFQRLQPGICVGHFDHDDDLTETASVNAAYLDSVKAAGFKSIRFFHSTQKRPLFYEANVLYALEAGLTVNVCLFANGANTKSAEDFVRHWRGIAEHYRDFPPTLVFELFNEPALSLKFKDNAEVMRWINAAIAAIREVSPRRLLLVGGPQFMQSQFLSYVTPEHLTYRLPDGAGFAADKNLIGAFHMYEPHNYTMPQGKRVTLADLPRWQEQVTENLDRAAAWSAKWGKPVVMTEWASQSAPKDRADFLAYTRFVKDEAAKRSIGWMYYCGVPRGYLAYLGPVMNWSILDNETGWDADALQLLTGVHPPLPAPAFNLLKNGEFAPGIGKDPATAFNGWRTRDGTQARLVRQDAMSGPHSFQITLGDAAAECYQDAAAIAQNQKDFGAAENRGIHLRQGSTYRLSLLAQATKPGATLTVKLHEATAATPLTTGVQPITLDLTHVGAATTNARLTLTLSGGPNVILLDRIQLLPLRR